MRRRYGYYWAKLIGTVLVLAAWVLGFVWIGDSWWQLAMAAALAILMTQAAFLGHDAAHRQIGTCPLILDTLNPAGRWGKRESRDGKEELHR